MYERKRFYFGQARVAVPDKSKTACRPCGSRETSSLHDLICFCSGGLMRPMHIVFSPLSWYENAPILHDGKLEMNIHTWPQVVSKKPHASLYKERQQHWQHGWKMTLKYVTKHAMQVTNRPGQMKVQRRRKRTRDLPCAHSGGAQGCSGAHWCGRHGTTLDWTLALQHSSHQQATAALCEVPKKMAASTVPKEKTLIHKDTKKTKHFAFLHVSMQCPCRSFLPSVNFSKLWLEIFQQA